MTLEELKKRNAERREQMQSSSPVNFIGFKQNGDCAVVKLIAPFDGYMRLVKKMNSEEYHERPHYRMHKLGDYNFKTQKHLTDPPIDLTIKDIRALKNEDAFIWTTPITAEDGFREETDKGHSIFLVTRHGVPKDPKTYYTVLNAAQIDDDEWSYILPSVSKVEIIKFQKEETFDMLPEEELHRLKTAGLKVPVAA